MTGRIVLLLVALSGLTAGCSSDTSGHKETDSVVTIPSSGEVSDGSDARELAPAAAAVYDASTVTLQDMKVVNDATQALVLKCMNAAGFDYAPIPLSLVGVSAFEMFDRPYSEADAMTVGYLSADPPPTPMTQEEIDLNTKIANDPAYALAYFGSDSSPGTGCINVANARLNGESNVFVTQQAAMQNALLSWKSEVRSSDEYRTAESAWSACMKTHGYTYTALGEPQSSDWGASRPSPDEIATATADIECRRTSHVLEVGYAALDRLAVEWLTTNPSAIEDISEAHGELLKRAADV